MKERIGIFGGTFNPIHLAHITMAKAFISQAQLSKCYFVPAFSSPFKANDIKKNYPTPAQRLEMVELAVAHHPSILVSKFEIERNCISYSIDTVEHFRASFPEADLFMLIGTDQAISFNRWKSFQDISSIVQICIVRRPEPLSADDIAIIEHTFGSKPPIWIDAPIMEITSTIIRDRISKGITIEKMIDERVEEYMRMREFYK